MPLQNALDLSREPALHSFITGIGERASLDELARLRIGTALRLRRASKPIRGCAVEIRSPAGSPLGWLPREDEAALEALGIDPDTATVRVAAIVPAFQRPRVRIQILLPDPVAEVAPAA
ncbi:hypothetical protein DOO78_22990 [Roseicella frigidaeris]|uniref:HIRAN domain-containing protein n=2 Tax=Roseicella frigidaeris TaxID=2230885 RepID=A0A327LZB8_9PROT|nr:hypothetical protein DOO78_22990 [Roseicella frigidaeris]